MSSANEHFVVPSPSFRVLSEARGLIVAFSGRLLVWRWDFGSRSRDVGTSVRDAEPLCSLQRSCVCCAPPPFHPPGASGGCARAQRSHVRGEVHPKETVLSPGFGVSVLRAD